MLTATKVGEAFLKNVNGRALGLPQRFGFRRILQIFFQFFYFFLESVLIGMNSRSFQVMPRHEQLEIHPLKRFQSLFIAFDDVSLGLLRAVNVQDLRAFFTEG